MMNRTIKTFSLAQKRFCWGGIGIRSTDSADRNMPAHRHSFFQIFFVRSGTAVHEIANRVFNASAGHIFFVSPYTVHRVVFPADSRCYVIYFDTQFIQRSFALPKLATQEAEFYDAPELYPFTYQPFCSYVLDSQATLEMSARCERIAAACDRKGIFDQADARAELTLLLTTVGKQYSDEFKQIDKAGSACTHLNKRARAALTYLKENFRLPMSLEDVAAKVNLTGTYLTYLLKQETGKSFKPLLDELRLENSKTLLAHTDMSLQTVALASGFPDQAHFTKRFKAYAAMAPGRFRRQRQASILDDVCEEAKD